MKKVFFSLAFMLIGSFAMANSEKKLETKDLSIDYKSLEIQTFEFIDENSTFVKYEYSPLTESCTITSVTQVISNGEVTYQSTTLFHLDGMSCETFFGLIASALCRCNAMPR
jgi:hypothetical protein